MYDIYVQNSLSIDTNNSIRQELILRSFFCHENFENNFESLICESIWISESHRREVFWNPDLRVFLKLKLGKCV